MRYIPSKFQFSNNPADIDAIKSYYDNVKSGLENLFDEKNPTNTGKSLRVLNYEKNKALLELNIEGGFVLLSVVECVFRTDFICRCRKNRKEDIDKDFKVVLNGVDQLYKIDLRESILERWKEEFPGNVHDFSVMKERFDYRNWIAHGRYWKAYGNAGKDLYSFDNLYREVSSLLSLVGHRLLKVENIGEPIHHVD